jgi:hypothetical protein
VIGSKAAHHGIGILCLDQGRGECKRRSSSAGRRFDNDIVRRQTGQLLHDRGNVGGTTNNQDPVWVRDAGEAVERLLQERLLAGQRQQELGPGRPAERPKPRS